MASLLDLGPLTEEVHIRGVKLTIHGLTALQLFKLFSEFPDMQKMIGQLGNEAAMLSLAPELIGKVIAMVTGSGGSKEVEEKAKELGAADQLTILGAVQRLSFPQGFGPFVNQLAQLMGTDITTSPGTTAEQGTNSHAPSSAALQTDSPGMTRGTSPRVN
jgi:hypothetical protein